MYNVHVHVHVHASKRVNAHVEYTCTSMLAYFVECLGTRPRTVHVGPYIHVNVPVQAVCIHVHVPLLLFFYWFSYL